jgi:hypothetical protein
MKSFRACSAGWVAVCGAALSILVPSAVSAASPAYCALYAREYTAQFTTGSDADEAMASEYKIQEQAYYQCLNMDVEPEFPATSVYFGTGLNDILAGVGGPLEGVAEGDASFEEPVAEAAPAAKPAATQTASRSSGRGSGLQPWTPEWEAWCKAHYPNSFDPNDGTVMPFNESRRFCR